MADAHSLARPEPGAAQPPEGLGPQLLVVEDDVHLADALCRYLTRAGYRVTVAHDGPEALRAYAARVTDLVVLDLMLPAMDGWEVCRRLRATSTVPIIMLTARAAESDRVLGLRLGADDYVVKPFSLRELQARIDAVLRRTAMTRDARGRILYDDGFLRLEGDGRQVLRDGEPIALTATERRLLFALAEAAGNAVPVTTLLQVVWGPSYIAQHNYIKLYVWRLRQKIEPDPKRPTYVQTVRGLGYCFRGRQRAGD